MPCRSTRSISSGSMLPPDSTATNGGSHQLGLGHDRGDAGRAGRLDDQLGPLQQVEQGLGEHLLAHRRELVDQLGDDRERHVARAADRDAVGHRGHPVQRRPGGRPPARAGTPRPARPARRSAVRRVAWPGSPWRCRPAAPRRRCRPRWSGRRGTARGSPGRPCPGRRRCRRGRTGGSAPRRSPRRTPWPPPGTRRSSRRAARSRRRSPRVAISLGIGAPIGM